MTISPTKTADESGRGAETRRRLIRAGLELFGACDFDNVTTRQLAEAAGVNLAAIPYHFGTKEKLHLAVAEHIVTSIADALADDLEAIRRCVADEGAETEDLLQALHSFIVSFAREILGSDDAAARAGFILRQQLSPGAAFDVLYQGVMHDAHRTLTALVARILGAEPGSPRMVRRAHAILGQVLFFRMAREVVLRELDTDRIDAGQVGEEIAVQTVVGLRAEAHAAGGSV